MILPGKHTTVDYSLLGVGGVLLSHLHRPQTVSGLWETSKAEPGLVTFERFVLALSLLYALDAVDWQDGLLVRGDVQL